MKLKNITDGKKQLMDLLTGKLIVVDGKKTIELEKASYNPNAFNVVKERIRQSKKHKTEQKEKLKNEKEVN